MLVAVVIVPVVVMLDTSGSDILRREAGLAAHEVALDDDVFIR